MIDDATLFSYLDGALPEDERQRVEAAIAADTQLAERVARHRTLERAAHDAFAEELHEPVPAGWIAAIDDALPASTNVTHIAAARERRKVRWPSWQAGGAIAAALVLGLALGRTMQSTGGQIVIERDGALMASAPVADALDARMSGVPAQLAEGRTLDVQLSLRGADGRFCREAVIHDTRQAQRLLACRDKNGWQVAGLAREAVPGAGYQQVSGDGPLDALVETIGGEPLDAAGEKAAIARGWQR